MKTIPTDEYREMLHYVKIGLATEFVFESGFEMYEDLYYTDKEGFQYGEKITTIDKLLKYHKEKGWKNGL